MDATETSLIKDEVNQTFSSVWFVSVLVAIISVVPTYLLRDTNPWIIALPIVIGVTLNLVFEILRVPAIRFRGRTLQVDAPRISVFPQGYDNFSGLSEIMVVELTNRQPKRAKLTEGQMDLFGDTPSVNLRRLRIFRESHGNKLVAMDCDRFVELLVTDAAESIDKSLEASLVMTLKRFAGAPLNDEQLYLISDRVAREIIKSDIRGNLLVHLTRNGEATIKKVLKQFYESEAQLCPGMEPSGRLSR